MAANMKAVKLRMKSIQSTMQITKAMELVASSKLRKAKNGQMQAGLISTLWKTHWNRSLQATQIFLLYIQRRAKTKNGAM